MRARALGGLGLLASAMLCLAATLTASAEVMWGAGAWAGVGQQNANQNAARAAQWARRSTQDSARLARRSGRSSFVGNVIALLIVIAVLVVAAPFVLEIIARV
ncbi:hypothetical protein AB0L53_41565 [Nonomuraea sp. NPDC052129]|uniref:hypothetical protein n=1 Tax=Nonomuraea sp. NPDC052129 TaxID=3154651 RepID=UPI00343F371D